MPFKSVKTCLLEILKDPRLTRNGQQEAIRLLKTPGLIWPKLEAGRPGLDSEGTVLVACRKLALDLEAHPMTRLESIKEQLIAAEGTHRAAHES